MFIFQIICFAFTISKNWFEKLMKIFNERKKIIDASLFEWTSMPQIKLDVFHLVCALEVIHVHFVYE
jgi:hypothetical protein